MHGTGEPWKASLARMGKRNQVCQDIRYQDQKCHTIHWVEAKDSKYSRNNNQQIHFLRLPASGLRTFPKIFVQ